LHFGQPVTDKPAPSDARSEELDDAMRTELLSYLSEHPSAMDSLEGVVEWWLPRQQVRNAVERVARALEVLTREGLIEQVSDGERVLYRLRGGGPVRE
jgi:hypothetical protein